MIVDFLCQSCGARSFTKRLAKQARDRALAYVPPLVRAFQPDPYALDVCGRHSINEVCTCGT